MKLKLSLLLLSCIVFQICAYSQAKSNFRIVGNYALNTAKTADLKTVPFDKVTHINLTFYNPDDTLGGNFTSDLSSLIPFVKEAHAKNVKVLLSIGGGSRHTWYAALLKDDKRNNLINGFIASVLKYDFDGINNDIEGADVDENYEKFALGMSKALKTNNKLFTASLPGNPRAQVTDQAIASYDYINIMSYDHSGAWAPTKPGPHASYEQSVADLEGLRTKRGVPDQKLNLGVPFYSKVFGPELTSPVTGMNYKQIVALYPGAELVDEWKTPEGKTIYYNGMPTIRNKVLLAKEKAGGIMIWQLLADDPGPKSLLQVINDTVYQKK
jgi:chitinase